MKATTNNLMTVEQTDEIICNASPENGAIEDCEVEAKQVRYFFETGAIGTVCRITGNVTIEAAAL